VANKIEVLDAIMGSGKSTSMLKWVDEQPNGCFLYVTPLLTESEVRVVEACTINKFTAPSVNEKVETKSSVLLDMLKAGVNISITQSLYSMLTKEHLSLIELNEYTIILDEEVSFIYPIGNDYSHNDFKYLKGTNRISVDDSGRVVWLDTEILDNTKYSKLCNMCNLGMVYEAKRDGGWFVMQMPIDLLRCAKRVILMTYLFEGSVLDSFLKLKGFDVLPFTEVKVRDISKESIRRLIEFVGDRQVEYWSAESFSSHWYTNKANQKMLTKLAKDIRAIANSEKAKSGEVLWCVPSVYAKPKKIENKRVAPISYGVGSGAMVGDLIQGNFLQCSSRATNGYRDRWLMIHCFNRFPNRAVAVYLEDYGFPVDDERFALAEFLQWLWRSRIRNGEPIKVCILPKRMRKLFQDWLAED